MPNNGKTLVYLACPYSDERRDVRVERFEKANWASAHLMSKGEHVFSPISHTHPIAEAGGLPLGFDYWEAYDRAVLDCCKAVYVLTLPGWQESVGVQAEIRIASEFSIPVYYLEPSAEGLVSGPVPADGVN